MSRLNTTTGEFARHGFSDARQASRTWERWVERRGSEPPLALASFAPAALRDQALEAVARMAEQDSGLVEEMAADPEWTARVVRVAGASTTLAQFLARHPEEARLLQADPVARGREGWMEFFASRADVTDQVATSDSDAVRVANHAALLQVAARDLSSEDPESIVDEVGAELSHVADAVMEMALAHARAEVEGWEQVRFAVLAMGKTGAQELNYISDVDVIFVCEPDGIQVEEAMQVGTRLAAAMSRFCSATTTEGTIWPLDAALRPEGKAGPLVRTIDSFRAYYGKWASNWEFQALLKARPAAGDMELGQEFVDMVAPMVWSAGERPQFLSEARAMRNRVISLVPPKQANREIKLGEGGLRDTEFSVQVLQLVHGRADERIRSRGTFPALDQLVRHGYIGRADGADMEAAYRFQRVLEHRVQLRRLRRDHVLPSQEDQLQQIARTLSMSVKDLNDRWKESTRSVRRLQQRIFFSPLLDAVSTIPASGLRLSSDAAQTRLRALGFMDPRAALTHIEALTRGSSRTSEIQRQLMPAMLGWFAQGPDPDFGLLAFRQLSEALGDTTWYLRALRDEGYMAKRLATIASSSRYVVGLLQRAPSMIQMLASRDELQPRSAETLFDSMRAAASRQDETDKAIASVRAIRRAELCRIALSDVLMEAELEVVEESLTDLAQATVDAGLMLARREIDAPEVGVIAMGRWGGREMSYSSDVDAMYVVPNGTDSEGLAAATALVRRAAEIIGAPGPDPALVVDTGLRPEGKDGAQVRTVGSYQKYYGSWSSTWESQALLRARPGAGNLELCREVLEVTDALRYPRGGLTQAQVTEIRRLKSRMESERIPRGVPRARHLKLGSGGLSDVEWTVQLLQLQHAHEHRELRTTRTLDALEGLRANKIVSERQAQVLRRAWEHVSHLRNALMLVRGRASDSLPADFREMAVVAQLLDYDPYDTGLLVDDTRRFMRRAAQAAEALFWGS